MKSLSSLLLVLALFGATSVVHAITLCWETPDETWGANVTGGALVYNASDSVTYNAASLVALAKDGTEYTGFTNVVNTAETSSDWNFNGWQTKRTSVLADSAQQTSGTYFLVLFDADSKYAIAQFAASEVTNAWSSGTAGSPAATYFTPTFSGTLVPEPSLLALLALGVAGLALKRRA